MNKNKTKQDYVTVTTWILFFEVFGLNLGPDKGYSECGVRFSSVLPAKCRVTTTTASLQNLLILQSEILTAL
jgi:hypothetical protein